MNVWRRGRCSLASYGRDAVGCRDPTGCVRAVRTPSASRAARCSASPSEQLRDCELSDSRDRHHSLAALASMAPAEPPTTVLGPACAVLEPDQAAPAAVVDLKRRVLETEAVAEPQLELPADSRGSRRRARRARERKAPRIPTRAPTREGRERSRRADGGQAPRRSPRRSSRRAQPRVAPAPTRAAARRRRAASGPRRAAPRSRRHAGNRS